MTSDEALSSEHPVRFAPPHGTRRLRPAAPPIGPYGPPPTAAGEWAESLRRAAQRGEVVLLTSSAELVETLRTALAPGAVAPRPTAVASPTAVAPTPTAPVPTTPSPTTVARTVVAPAPATVDRPPLVRRAGSWSPRERAVVRLLADGLSTGEVAAHLSYSERTIKGIVHDLTNRFGLRNRTHTVAYAIRTGVI